MTARISITLSRHLRRRLEREYLALHADLFVLHFLPPTLRSTTESSDSGATCTASHAQPPVPHDAGPHEAGPTLARPRV